MHFGQIRVNIGKGIRAVQYMCIVGVMHPVLPKSALNAQTNNKLVIITLHTVASLTYAQEHLCRGVLER